MGFNFPRDLPSHTGARAVEFHAINTNAISRSPFTLASQTFDWGGEMWQADISLPTMARADAEGWIAWLLSLRGRSKTFLLGDPLGVTPRGSARNVDGLAVDGAGQTGFELSIDGAPASRSNYLRAGDWLQLGTGSTARLYKIMSDADSNGAGEVDLDIWPALRSSPADGASVVVENAVGVFRLASDAQSWSANTAAHYGLTFGAEEVVA